MSLEIIGARRRKLPAMVLMLSVLFFGLGSTPARAALLSDLIAGGSLSAFDLDFTGWTLNSSSGSPAPDPTIIEVTTLLDDPDNPGLLFTANGQLQASLVNTVLTLNLGFEVSSNGRAIIGNSMALLDSLIAGNGNLGIDELLGSGMTPLGTLTVERLSMGGTTLFDSQAFAAQTSVQVTKNILVELEGGAGDQAVINVFDQRFALQPSAVPVPGSLLLGLLGLLGLHRCSRKVAACA